MTEESIELIKEIKNSDEIEFSPKEKISYADILAKNENLPHRDDPIYEDIDNFELFELTTCIVYEMAVRNEKVKKIIDTIQKLNYTKNKLKNKYRNKLWKLNKEKFKGKNPFAISNSELGVPSPLTDYFLINKLVRKLKDEYLYIYYNNSKPEEGLTALEAMLKKREYKRNRKEYQGFIISQGMYFKDNSYAINTIRTNFKRVIYNPNETNLQLNYSLPIEELIDYVGYIKNTYDYNDSIIKSPLEMLGKELNISKMNYTSLTAKEWSDCFYIYDFYQSSSDKTKKTKILKLQEIFTRHYGYKVEKTKTQLRKDQNKGINSKFKIVSYEAYHDQKVTKMYKNKEIKQFYSDRTIEDRLKLMESLINDLKYKTLILG